MAGDLRYGLPAEVRRERQDAHGTFGVMLVDGEEVAKTVERPWANNAVGLSCVPAGVYECRREYSPRFKRDLFELKGVPGRSEAKIHPANVPSELHGCIALGEAFGVVRGEDGVVNSRATVAKFEALYDGYDAFWLTITDPVGA